MFHFCFVSSLRSSNLFVSFFLSFRFFRWLRRWSHRHRSRHHNGPKKTSSIHLKATFKSSREEKKTKKKGKKKREKMPRRKVAHHFQYFSSGRHHPTWWRLIKTTSYTSLKTASDPNCLTRRHAERARPHHSSTGFISLSSAPINRLPLFFFPSWRARFLKFYFFLYFTLDNFRLH